MKKTHFSALKFKKLFVIAFYLMFMCLCIVQAQYINEYDYHDATPPPIPPLQQGETWFSENGLVHTPQGELKILLIFAEFDDNLLGVRDWLKGELPDYPEVLYSNVNQFNTNNTDLSLSNYFYQMSKHSTNPFKLYGEIFPEVIPVPKPTSATNFSTFNTQVLDYIETNYPNFNWSSFDQRTNYPGFKSDNVNSSPDGKIDYVVISYRWNNGCDPWTSGTTKTYILQNHNYYSAGAVAGLLTNKQITSNSGTYSVSSGYTVFTGSRSQSGYRDLFLHEFAHNLYSAPHYNGANNISGNYFYTSAGWGMMAGSGYKKYCALGWEKWWLGWDNIKYDIDNPSDNGYYYLHDFIQQGDMMRIKIPNTDQYLWLEYHSGESVFDERASFLTNGIGSTIPQATNGLIAYVENMGDKNSPYIFSSGANGIKFISGDGNYDYTNSSTCTPYPEWWGNCLYNYNKTESNPFSGQNQLIKIRADYDSDGVIKWSTNTNGNGGDEQKGIMVYNNQLSYDEFCYDAPLATSQRYSIGSNPALIEHQNYNSSLQKLSPIRLHGLSIQFIEQNSSYAKIYVKFDYNKVENNTRWTGNIELPTNQNITIDGATVTVDRSGTPSREYYDADFGFLPYSYFTLKSASELSLTNSSNLLIKEKSTLALENGSELNIENSILDIESNSNLLVKSGTSNIVNNGTININGNLSFESGARLIVSGGGVINYNGTIITSGSGILTLQGSNYLKLNGTFNATPGAKLTIEGINKNTKIIELLDRAIISSNFDNITIKNGKIQVNNTSDYLDIQNGVENVLIDNVTVTGPSTASNSGIIIRTDKNITVKNSTFTNCYTALGI